MSDTSSLTLNAILGALQANSQNAQVRDAILAAIASSQATSSSGPTQGTCTHVICQACVCPHGMTVAAAPGGTSAAGAVAPPRATATGTAYYAVFVGRATGVFTSLALVQALTTRVSGNTYYKFSTHDEAEGAYADADRLGLVRTVN
ncbi:hypothetical protein GYMLUDRAFT_61894 [Collybiopsis luxurians FD-317 M1]|uniref:Ribonuclease H1 N-terminal domain-containing protein n=1 Tax=Collybiopsis luxurians FD-317 M1 TaxID=944289 RepID=A0A0D0BNR9_9AGAR|nr:hypothetical protein GYMLUDRAFT_61894 [Collybiopsis luxurians FD-317 M1]